MQQAGHEGIRAEEDGRESLGALDMALLDAAGQAGRAWTPAPVPSAGGLEVTLLSDQAGPEWLLAVARAATGSLTVTAAVERGRDGLDLPLAAVVGSRLVFVTPRLEPPVADGTGASGGEVALLEAQADLLAWPGMVLRLLAVPWGLDEGTRLRLQFGALEAPAGHVRVIPGGGPAVVFIEPGAGTDPADPFVMVALGGADIDASGRGDLFGVLVSDGGSIALEGTRLHGAAFATGDVRLGQTGQVLFDRALVRQATDRSTVRVRLQPGSRREEAAP